MKSHFLCKIELMIVPLFSARIASATIHYNYFLELCSLIFLVAITICYWSRKKFPTSVFRIFGVCLLIVSINVGFGVFSCYALDNPQSFTIGWAEYILSFYYFMQVLTSYFLFVYILYTVGKSLRYAPLYNLTMIPSLVLAVLIFTNGAHHSFVYVTDEGTHYLINHGSTFFLLYVICGLNVFSTVVYTIAFRKTMSKKVMPILLTIIGLVSIAEIIQAIQSNYFVMGVSYTLSMMFAIITINDPDEKVDRISGAFNNDAFIDYINSQRIEKQLKYYVIFDIESFGMLNETFGHLYSSALLEAIRKFIHTINKKVLIFRTQSSKFVCICKTPEEQTQLYHALKARCTVPFFIKDRPLNVTIHLFWFHNDGAFRNSDGYNDFLNRAQGVLNFKDDNFVQLDKAFINRVNRDRRIREILKECLDSKKGLYMVYQPIFDIVSKKFNHFEALIRLSNDELGYIGPAEFIPIAESFGLASEIDYFVMNETCAFLKRHPEIENLEINVSCAEFFNNPSERFLAVVKKHGINPERICLEITETVAVKYPTKTKEFMDDLGKYGIKFAMDDFGSGYSNIARFISLPFSIAKLDKSLLGDENNVRIFFDSAIQLFKNLNIPIVVEGVETDSQLALSKEKQIDFIQGYYFSRPLKENDLIKFLAKHNA